MAERELSRDPIYRARPTVRIDDRPVDKVEAQILAMRMSEGEGGMSALELRLGNLVSDAEGGAAYAFEDEADLALGASLAIYAGAEAAPQEIFRGPITGIEATFSTEGAPELVVLAEDALQAARMARRTRVHERATIADLARAIAADLGLTPVVQGLADPIGTQVQYNESDLAFLRRLLAAHDGDVQVVGRELHVAPRQDVDRGAVELELHSQLVRARFTADLAHQATEVTASGWDAVQGASARGSSTGRSAGPGAGRTGASLLREAIGERSEHLDLPATTDDEAQAIADAHFDRRARRFVCVEATAEGNPAIRVGTRVTLKGFSARWNNTYYVVRACHRFDTVRGYLTDFEAECAYLGNP